MDGFDGREKKELAINGAALWEGCILASCVHGVMLPEYPFILPEHVWSGGIYVTRNEEGGKAALYFSENREVILGMFQDFRSERTELVLSGEYAMSHYQDAPEEIRRMAQALTFLFEAQGGEKRLPFVTAGIWGENGKIFCRDTQEDWLLHGGHILETQMLPFTEAMERYQVHCSMDERRMEIAERIYRERIQSPSGQAVLTEEEINALAATGPCNMEACQEVFGKFGIMFAEAE